MFGHYAINDWIGVPSASPETAVGNHRLPQRIRAHALICFMALVLYRVIRMRLKAAKRTESPTTLLEQLKRIHQQTVETSEGTTLTGLTEITPAQKSLFATLELTPPTPSDLGKPDL